MLVGMFEKSPSEVPSAFLVGVALNFLTLGGTISKTTHFDTFILFSSVKNDCLEYLPPWRKLYEDTVINFYLF